MTSHFSLICPQKRIRYWDPGSNEKASIPLCIYKNIKEEFIPENFCFITDIGESSCNYSCFKGFSKNTILKKKYTYQEQWDLAIHFITECPSSYACICQVFSLPIYRSIWKKLLKLDPKLHCFHSISWIWDQNRN